MPGRPTVLIATLSLTTAVKVTVWVCDEVLRSTVVSSTEKLVIDGSWSSALLILIVTVSVIELLAVSVTVSVTVSVSGSSTLQSLGSLS